MNFAFLSVLCLLVTTPAFADYSEADTDRFWGSERKGTPVGGDLKQAEKISPPAELTKRYPTQEYRFFAIDLDSDGRQDFIVEHRSKPKVCFVNSKFVEKHCEEGPQWAEDVFRYLFFAQLNETPMLELFIFSGDSDFSDYRIEAFDAKTWKLARLMNINPVIDSTSPSEKGLFRGPLWDITGLSLKKIGKKIQLNTAFDDKRKFDEFDDPQDIRTVLASPYVVFTGNPSQDRDGSYTYLQKQTKWRTLAQLTFEWKKRSARVAKIPDQKLPRLPSRIPPEHR